MSRRLTAAAALTVLGVAMLPALPAFASAASSATLTGTKAVYPGGNSFSITVTNNESPVTGKTINALRVNLPVNEAGIRLGESAGTTTTPGFTGSKTDLGSTQFLTYRGGRLLPGQSTIITFPVTVGSPVARDLLGDFRVQVSSDDFATNKNATTTPGGLTAKVQILEIVAGSVKPVSPAGAADLSGTAGQTVTFATTIKNHAQQAVSVTTGISSTAGDTSSPATITVPGNLGTADASVPVTLGPAATDRTSALTATARKSDGSAVAPDRSTSYTVQAPATLAFTNLQPTRTKSGEGSGRDFTATATKSGSQTLNLVSSVLSFGGNTCSAVDPKPFPAGSNSQTVTFRCPTLTGVDRALLVSAASDGALKSTIASTAVDGNEFAGYRFSSNLADVIIDNAGIVLGAVTVALPNDLDGEKQVAAKNNDTITVSGTLADVGDTASLTVILQPNAGPAIPVTVSRNGNSYSGTVRPTFVQEASTFVAKTEARDTAGNTTSAASLPEIIDNVLPDLGGPEMTEFPGIVTGPTTIEVRFVDTTGVAGGCDARNWSIDGVPGSVTKVEGNGSDCLSLGSGGRILTLSNPLTVDQTPRVTYEGTDARIIARPAKDGAGNVANRDTINTVTNLIPRVPNIVRLERRDGSSTGAFEPAFMDAEGYFTNVAGQQALRLTVGGIRQGYSVQVLKNGTPVVTETFTASPGPLATEYDGSVLVPLDAVAAPTAGTATNFSVRLISARGNIGDAAPFRVVLDTVVPALRSATLAGTTVTVPFSEKIAKGTDFSDDWFVSETVDTENGTARRTVNANSVTANGMESRTLEVTLADASRFAGADYFLQSSNGVRYEDRAGNTLANTLNPA